MNESEREARLSALARAQQLAEQAYDGMYEAHSHSQATARYSDAKEALYDAIAHARALGLAAQAEALEQRLAHIKAVFRSQFSA